MLVLVFTFLCGYYRYFSLSFTPITTDTSMIMTRRILIPILFLLLLLLL